MVNKIRSAFNDTRTKATLALTDKHETWQCGAKDGGEEPTKENGSQKICIRPGQGKSRKTKSMAPFIFL